MPARRRRDGRCVTRRSRTELAQRHGEGAHEDARPAEHGGEGHGLERRGVDDAAREQRARDREVAEHPDRRAAHAAVQAAEHPRGGQQHAAEAGHHAVRHDVVHELVDGERDAAGEREVRAEHRQQHARRGRRAALRRVTVQPQEVAVQALREGEHREARQRQSGVEHRAGGIREHPEPAEVQVPPQRVGGGEDRRADAGQHDRHHHQPPVQGGEIRQGDAEAGSTGREDDRAHCGHPSTPEENRPTGPVLRMVPLKG